MAIKPVGEIGAPPNYNCRVFVGGCVERGVGLSFRAKAHAHNSTSDKFFGWICIRGWRRVGVCVANKGTPAVSIAAANNLLKHEYAHILTPNVGHGMKWVDMFRSLGGKVPGHYLDRIKSARSRSREHQAARKLAGASSTRNH